MTNAPATFDLKASSFTFPTLYLRSADLDLLAEGLAERVEQAPDFFRNTPVVIDLSKLPGLPVELPTLVGILRGCGMVPVALRGGEKDQQRAAEMLELAILGEERAPVREPRPPREPPPDQQPSAPTPPAPPSAPPQARPAAGGSLLVTRPVRSGQRVYAAGGDLVVVAPISSGAELMADGHIHIYGALRGRALAGVQGNEQARIFCRDLRAELVSVAGRYRLSEDLGANNIGRPVQIYLAGERLVIEKM
jgi:septum site-determining protein MinC